MPLIVDHDERRNLIARVVKRMVAERGIEAVTVRAVAREAGFSSTIVAHYFRDKRDLMSFTYSTIRVRALDMIEAAFEAGMDVLDCFEKLLPVNETNLADWQAWFGFWGVATADAEIAAERIAGTQDTKRLFVTMLRHAVARGELPADLDFEPHADRLQLFINGLAAFVVMQPQAWPRERQRAMLAAEIELMRIVPGGLPQGRSSEDRPAPVAATS